ncbi:alanine racemase [Gordonia aichiensis]
MTDTPYLAVDAARVDRNLRTTAETARRAGVALRPHAKTHKTAALAKRQIDSGAIGLTVATIGEAEAFVAAGFGDLFIAYPLWVTAHKGARLRALAQQSALRLAVDSIAGAERMAAEVGGTGSGVEVLVEVDSGQHRTGVGPEFAGEVAAAAHDAGLDVIGVFTFPGHGYGPGGARSAAAREEVTALAEAADRLRSVSIEPRVRSGGSTPTVEFATDSDVLTEIRPGVYPFYDAQQIELGVCEFGDVALTAVSTVVHRDGHRAVLDAGSKIIGADRPAWASGHGRILDDPDARIVGLSEHHAVIEYPPSAVVPELGTTVGVIPNHVCTAVNLVDELVVDDARSGGAADRWPVIARGANS